MAFPRRLKDLCTPALFYFVVSMLGFLVILFHNIGNKHTLHLGNYKANVSSTLLIFILKLIYILFWTWILNLICKDGKSGIAWFLVLIPFVLAFVVASFLLV